MLQQQTIGAIGMSIDDSRQDQAVVVDEEIVDAVDIHDQFAALGMGAAEKLRDRGIDDRQRRRMGSRDQRGVESVIRLATAHRILNRLDDPLEGEAEGLEVRRRGALAGEPHGLPLDGDARLQHILDGVRFLGERERKELAEHREIRPSDDRAVTAANFDRADSGERAQRLAHERPADAQRDRELPFGEEAVARLQLAGNQLFADETDHAFVAARFFFREPRDRYVLGHDIHFVALRQVRAATAAAPDEADFSVRPLPPIRPAR